ncbi:16S rRNA (guanine(966)-N(2))-methyltransferase RsmD [Helicobacter apodemus]|uniref:16S rRNA (Guanine(966)-N(2))-methyltransferase RsmD n=1 Tax=Helicobacter apodemus TaxID=135569 RepID=A0A2U8FE21_9HELI|nr:16S rRNA (guanine(966)-N(2))-methyltransferase RsmD [Helicobacter apodemus]AWI34404.1 16S rRNA (guanine(966)-N(2))-methyltransferase RsmD [Helicobacter apodemus]
MPKTSFKHNSLKVIGGDFKGRKLKMAPLEITRSSKNILKESFFNTLGNTIVGTNFIEFFAGSGSIGIEALSRGAKYAFFFENHKESYKVLEENLRSICQDCAYKTIFGDTFKTYKDSLKSLKSETIGYLDPPFDIRENMQGIYKRCFDLIEDLDCQIFSNVILEHISSLEIPQKIGSFTLHKTKKFGKSALSYYQNLYL